MVGVDSCSAERFGTRPTPSKGADGGLPGALEGRDIPGVIRVCETIQERKDERFKQSS
jgi:hypothetical protein